MEDFSQFQKEDNLTFVNKMMVYFSQCSRNRKLSLNELLRITSDTAVQDYNVQGKSREFLLEKGYAILVSRCAFRIHKMPEENQNITVTSWEEKPQPLQLMRQYEITDTKTGEALVTGYSGWLVVDPVNRRIIPSKKFDLGPAEQVFRGHDCMEPGKINVPEEMELWGQRTICYSDLDSNGHTNNSRYGAFIADFLPAEFKDRIPKDFKINYAKEAMLGDMLDIMGSVDVDQNRIVVVGKTEAGVSFEGELFY